MIQPSALMPFAYFRKKVIGSQDAVINIASHSLQYGTTCFGGIRGYFREGKVRIFRLEDHFLRLTNAAKILGMRIDLAWQEFRKVITELIHANQPKSDFYIRPFLFSEDQLLTPRFDGLNFDLAIYLLPLAHYFDPHRGLRLMISSWRKLSDTMVSTKAKAGGCYVNSALATSDAKRSGYDDALMMDEQGNIVEASIANLFLVYRGEVLMPEVGSSMLEGITRRAIIDFLQEEGRAVRAERIDRSMVYTSDEIILTGTAAQVLFAHSVDGRIIGQGDSPGPICQLMRQRFAEVIAGRHANSNNWITEFHIGNRP
jgi:branched-chain amino acid aminotransferase